VCRPRKLKRKTVIKKIGSHGKSESARKKTGYDSANCFIIENEASFHMAWVDMTLSPESYQALNDRPYMDSPSVCKHSVGWR